MHRLPGAACIVLAAVFILATGVQAFAGRSVIDAIIHVESKGNPNAKGQAREIGLMQIKYATARSVGYRGTRAGLFDPAVNRRYGTAYFNLAMKRAGGDLHTAISLYQRGVYSRFRGCSAYCRKVLRAM